MFKKLKKKFIILNMTMMSIVIILSFATIYVITINNVENQDNLKLEKASSNAWMYLDNKDNSKNYNQIIVGDIPSNYYNQAFSILVDEDGKPQFNNSMDDAFKDYILKIINIALKQEGNSKKIKVVQKQYKFSVVSVFKQNSLNSEIKKLDAESLKLISFIDITDSQKTLNELLITLIVIGMIMLIVIFIISIYFAKRSVLPIESSYIKQKQFIADASHELKTPIASIGANIDALKSSPNETVMSQKKWIDYIDIEIESMNKLVGDLLYLAKSDGNPNDFEFSPIDLSNLVNNSILTMEAVSYEKGITVKQDVDAKVIINGDSEKSMQVIKILLDNAVKYVDDNGNIYISLKESKNNAIFTITNTGDGIESIHYQRIFDRFYRVDQSRINDGSYGLGLSIAKSIVQNMGGNISVSSIIGESTTFTVTLNK